MICLSVEECRLWRGEHVSRRTWKRQLTCVTSSGQRLPWFVDELVRHLAPFDHALLVIDQVVFSVRPELEALRRAAAETRNVREAPGHLFEMDEQGFRRVLELAFVGGFDFRVLLSPSAQALRADHDDYTTFFSTSPGRIAELRGALAEGEVKIVRDWTAEMP